MLPRLVASSPTQPIAAAAGVAELDMLDAAAAQDPDAGPDPECARLACQVRAWSCC